MEIASTASNRSGTDQAPRREPSARRAAWMLWLWITVLVGVSWSVGRSGLYESGTGTGYLLGLFGGVMMLLLFMYPMKKHWRFMRAWGATKHWFSLHMLLGIGGPLLILMHSTFRIGSINAAVALTCMLLVAGSGVVGRFIYTRIHHGLYGERARFRDLQSQLEVQAKQLHSEIGSAPRVEALLMQFEGDALGVPRGVLGRTLSFVTFGLRMRLIRRRCMAQLEPLYREQALRQGWGDGEFLRRLELARALIDAYVGSIERVAQFSTYERMFSWWHVLHVPFVYMLVLSAIAHVVAVHIY
jgi:hypothetical protein